MEIRVVDSLDAEVSLLGFGAMRLPQRSDDPSDIDVDVLCGMVDLAIEGGVNYFDTAPGYHKGFSESAMRKALVDRYDRESYYLADKLSLFLCETPEDMRAMFERQIERCHVEYFDFYLIHAITEERYEQCKSFGAFDFARGLKDSGRVHRLGFSFHSTPEFLRQVLEEHPGEFEFVQLQINYLDWRSQRASEYYGVAREHGLPVIVMEPVKGGSLANLPSEVTVLDGRLRDQNGQAALALRFAASLDGVMTVLSGMSSIEQVRGNLETFSNFAILSDEERELIERILEETRKISQIPCTSCAYCVGTCPVGLEIPKLFSIYNELMRSGNEFHARYLYSGIAEGRRADSCISCRACVNLCPQGIDIPRELAALHPKLPLMAMIPDAVRDASESGQPPSPE